MVDFYLSFFIPFPFLVCLIFTYFCNWLSFIGCYIVNDHIVASLVILIFTFFTIKQVC